ncbi:ATP-binding cassette domain-containing protein, partial [Exiguobacterium sp.]
IKDQAERDFAEGYLKSLSVRHSSMDQPAKSLSGGNQQKVVLAKWLGTQPKVLILDEPTRGVDVGAKKEIYLIMNELAAAGVAIIMVSSDLPEILGMSDRVYVMREGKMSGMLTRQEATQESIMTLATGGQ